MARLILFIVILGGMALAALYVLSPIEPVTWKPAPNPGLMGDYAPNTRLSSVERLLENVAEGPEAIACGGDGQMYSGLLDGRILAFDSAGESREITNTRGRPLGMKLDADGNLIVADGVRGLLSVDSAGKATVLTDSIDGTIMRFVDDVDVADDGTIWFSDATMRYGYHYSMLDLLEGRPTGRLLSFDPQTGDTRVHIEGLMFANGVALGPDDAYVLVNETGTGRIHRLWLKGERAGERDLFHEGLPGTPDNITFNGVDTFWVAMPSTREMMDLLAGNTLLRRIVSLLPMGMLEDNAVNYSFVVGLGLDGEVRQNLQDDSGRYTYITSAIECNGDLYLGSLSMQGVGRYTLKNEH